MIHEVLLSAVCYIYGQLTLPAIRVSRQFVATKEHQN